MTKEELLARLNDIEWKLQKVTGYSIILHFAKAETILPVAEEIHYILALQFKFGHGLLFV